MRFILRGRCSIWWGWRVLTVAPRIVNDVSYVMWINHEIHFAWQAQYLVRLEGVDCCSRIVNDVSYVMRIKHEIHLVWQAQYLMRLEGVACCFAHCKWRFICNVAQSWHSFCVAGAVFGVLVEDSAIRVLLWCSALLASFWLAGGSCRCRFLCWAFLLEISWFG